MTKIFLRSAAALFCLGWAIVHASSLEEDFKNPSAAVGPYVWWHWMGSNISKEGITKDLEAMKASGIGGATIFNLASAVLGGAAPTGNLPFPDITYRSPKYWEMLRFAASEAERLGLELGMHNCPGYSATGGPWITPELSMQTVVFTRTPVNGPSAFSGVLPQPNAKLAFYRDIAVLAVPDATQIDPKEILDLSKQIDNEGRLSWIPPAGKWIVYRFGHTSTGKGPKPIPEDVKALEVDKMSASASKFHWEQVINPMKEKLGEAMGKSFRHLTHDSYEAGDQNWTPAFRQEFIRRKGYDPIPWLPLLDTKEVGDGKRKIAVPKLTIGSADQSDRFRWDQRDVIAQLFQENNFEQGARMMREAGVQFQFEPYGGPFDTIAGSATADLPMGEFWTHGGNRASLRAPGIDIVGAARAAGRRVIGAEAFTGRPADSEYNEDPAGLKVMGDGVYARGVNRFVLHHWVHQPFGDAFKPGMGMGWWGTHFGRNQTWAEPGKAYFKYLARTQALLQRGEGMADFLMLDRCQAGADAIPRAALLRGDVRVEAGQIVLPSGRRYPFLVLPNQEAMLPEVARKLKELVQEGAVIVGKPPTRSPSLSGYPGCDDEVRKIAGELWAKKPENSVGKGKVFAGSPAQVLEKYGITPPVTFAGQAPEGIRTTARREGDTEIFFVANASDDPCEVTPSFRVNGKQPEIWHAEDGSQTEAPVWRVADGRIEVPLRLRGKESLFVVFRKPAPQGDHVVSVTVSDPAKDWKLAGNPKGQPVLLASSKLAGEIVYASGKRVPFSADPAAPLPVSGAWDVAFAPGQGAPEKITFAELKSWSEHSDPAIKYFSGTATYRKTVEVPAALIGEGKRLILDLGAVSNLAAVKVNETDLGVCWYGPFCVDVTAALKPGQNTLEIAVTNTWANRLIGDEQEPADIEWGSEKSIFQAVEGRPLVAYPEWFVKGQPRPSKGRKTFSTWNYFTKDSALLPAGLIGPVVLLPAQERPL